MKNYFVPVATSIWTLFVVVSMVSAQVLPPPPIRAAGQAATTVKTPAQILQENNAAFALILSDGNSTVSLGSGFFIEDGSGLVTNFHVIEGAKVIYVKTGDGRTFNTDTAYAYDVKQDLAVLKVSPGVTQTAALGDSDKVVVGTPITVIGNPEGLEKSVTNGLISGIRTLDGQQLFQISAPISHGSSGGPVFDDKGRSYRRRGSVAE
jgi:serine protease Do